MRLATIISDEGGAILGVVVNLGRIAAEGKSGSCLEACAAYDAAKALCDELPDAEGRWLDAIAWRNRLHVEVSAYRWVPRDDGGGIRPHLEPAEPDSRGSWIGAYWSEPY